VIGTRLAIECELREMMRFLPALAPNNRGC
jgi:hypothetical protein